MADDSLIPAERIEQVIRLLRGEKVVLDADLAEFYGVETKALVRAVKRNLDRFPGDFMFQVSAEEFSSLRYQFGTSKDQGGRRYRPYAFTEHGVAMLSSVLRSQRAIQINVTIIRAFVRLRCILAEDLAPARRVAALEKKYDFHHTAFTAVFAAIRSLKAIPERRTPKIGFRPPKP